MHSSWSLRLMFSNLVTAIESFYLISLSLYQCDCFTIGWCAYQRPKYFSLQSFLHMPLHVLYLFYWFLCSADATRYFFGEGIPYPRSFLSWLLYHKSLLYTSSWCWSWLLSDRNKFSAHKTCTLTFCNMKSQHTSAYRAVIKTYKYGYLTNFHYPSFLHKGTELFLLLRSLRFLLWE